jgi:hypothetical protein
MSTRKSGAAKPSPGSARPHSVRWARSGLLSGLPVFHITAAHGLGNRPRARSRWTTSK